MTRYLLAIALAASVSTPASGQTGLGDVRGDFSSTAFAYCLRIPDGHAAKGTADDHAFNLILGGPERDWSSSKLVTATRSQMSRGWWITGLVSGCVINPRDSAPHGRPLSPCTTSVRETRAADRLRARSLLDAETAVAGPQGLRSHLALLPGCALLTSDVRLERTRRRAPLNGRRSPDRIILFRRH
jgi:hypothetical protein